MIVGRPQLHLLVLGDYAGADLQLLLDAARDELNPGVLYGEGRSRRRNRARALATGGAFVYRDGASAGWEEFDGWAAVLTAPGRCAAQRSVGETPTWTDLAGLRAAPGTGAPLSRLWCVEHGYLDADRVRTDKTCPHPGTPFHDRGLDRVGPVTSNRPSVPAGPRTVEGT